MTPELSHLAPSLDEAQQLQQQHDDVLQKLAVSTYETKPQRPGRRERYILQIVSGMPKAFNLDPISLSGINREKIICLETFQKYAYAKASFKLKRNISVISETFCKFHPPFLSLLNPADVQGGP